MKLLIKNATVVLPGEVAKTSVLVKGGKIVMVDPAVQTLADEVIDAGGLHLLPGVVDDQVHFRDPGLTHKEDLHTGSLACAKGGITTFLEMPNTVPNTTTRQRLHEKNQLGKSKCVVNFGFYMGATTSNVSELIMAKDTPGIKIFIGSSTGDLLVDDQEALEVIFAETTLPICAHCEDEKTIRKNMKALGQTTNVADHSKIRDAAAAYESTRRATELALMYRHRFHVLHVSTADELELLSDHQNLITAEVCAHHLFFHTGDYARLGTRIQMNPSIKTAQDNKELFEALLENAIQVIATDHAPHTLEEKALPYPKSPSGLPAVENSLALFLNEVVHGRMPLQTLVARMCDAPARVWNLTGKGRIAEGYDADLVLVDLNKSQEIRDEEQVTKSKWSPWHGTTLTGWPVRTLVGGHTVFWNGKFDAQFRAERVAVNHEAQGYWDDAISTRPK
ncbi:MAG: dihydroorotase [Candidatus Sumerlaeia bacterium]|nr:dihydroorotase [Candidatus Sumerlaeia bacterium]